MEKRLVFRHPIWHDKANMVAPIVARKGPAFKGPVSKGPASKGPVSKGPASLCGPAIEVRAKRDKGQRPRPKERVTVNVPKKIDVGADKAELRARMADARGKLSPEFRAQAAENLAEKARDPAFRAFLPALSGIIAGFLPIRSEISPLPLMRRLAAEGFTLALPRIGAEGLSFHAYRFGDALREGPLKTREPLPEAPQVAPDLILAALLAFDRSGARLGYGKAYYDRAFAAFPKARRVGLAFAMQEVAQVPREAHDALLEAVFTEE